MLGSVRIAIGSAMVATLVGSGAAARAAPVVFAARSAAAGAAGSDDPWLEIPGKPGPASELPGRGKRIVLLAGDEEYRGEEGLPMLARILAERHGFDCTVLFSIDPKTGAIDPDEQTNVPGLAALDRADLVIVLWRFRELPDADMKHFVDYVESGRPILALRTSTHAFQYQRHPDSPYAYYRFDAPADSKWPGGFGQQVLGDTWVAHHGDHGSQSTRGVVDPANADHPILRGVKDVWGPTDVYAIVRLLPTDRVLLRGQVLQGMQPTDPPLAGPKNEPMMPLLWARERVVERAPAAGGGGSSGTEKQRVVCSTIGASVDLRSADLRRALVNSAYWCVGLEDRIKPDANVDVVGDYAPTMFGFGKAKKGVKPSELAAPAKPGSSGEAPAKSRDS